MADIRRKAYQRNGVETIADSDGRLWLNEKHTEEGLDYKNWRVNTVTCLSDYRKQRDELVNEPKTQPNRIFMNKELAIKVTINWRTTTAHRFRTRLGFKQYDVFLTKE